MSTEAAWEAVRAGESPDQLILDPQTGLENFLAGLGLLLILGGIFCLISAHWQYGLPCLLVGALFFYLRHKLDEHYILDYKSKEVRFSRSFFGRLWERRVCGFAELSALAIESLRHSTKSETWWTYGLSLFLGNGQQVKAISTEHRDHGKVVQWGESVAASLDLPFHSAAPEQLLTVGRGPGGLAFSYKPYSIWPEVIQSVLFVATLAGVVGGLYVYLS